MPFTTGMLLGHWYLIDRNLSIDPFRRSFRFFAGMLNERVDRRLREFAECLKAFQAVGVAEARE